MHADIIECFIELFISFFISFDEPNNPSINNQLLFICLAIVRKINNTSVDILPMHRDFCHNNSNSKTNRKNLQRNIEIVQLFTSNYLFFIISKSTICESFRPTLSPIRATSILLDWNRIFQQSLLNI